MSQPPYPQAAPQRPKRRIWPFLVGIPLGLVALVVGYLAVLEFRLESGQKDDDRWVAKLGTDYLNAFVGGDFDAFMALTAAPDGVDAAHLTAGNLAAVVERSNPRFEVTQAIGYSTFGTVFAELTLGDRTESIELVFNQNGDKWQTADLLVRLWGNDGIEIVNQPGSTTDVLLFPGLYEFTTPDSPHLTVTPATEPWRTLFPGDVRPGWKVVPSQTVIDAAMQKVRDHIAACDGGDGTACAWSPSGVAMNNGERYEFRGDGLFNGLGDQSHWSAEPKGERWESQLWFTDYTVLCWGTGHPIDGAGNIDYGTTVTFDATPIKESTYITIDITGDSYSIKVV